MKNILLVGTGGFIGAVCRYLIGLIPLNETSLFPYKTFIINIIGCIVIGIINAVATKNNSINPQTLLFLKSGLCGGFTTFSTFALETSNIIKNECAGLALLYVLSTLLIGITLIFVVEYLILK